MRDLYSVLGVSRSASQDTIRKEYKKLARRYHPDLNKTASAAEKFKEINAAYDVIGDEAKRKLYDEFGEASLKAGFDARAARRYQSATAGFGGFGPGGFGSTGFNPRDPRRAGQRRRSDQNVRVDFGDFGFNTGADFRGGPNMDDLLNMFSGGQSRTPQRGANIEQTLTIGLREALSGTETTIQVSVIPGSSNAIRVQVPPGIHDGGTIRLRGKGQPGPRGIPPGDLLLKVRIQPHPVLKREGDDLSMDVPVTILEALNRARIEVPTLDGAIRVRIPANLGTGRKVRLKGKGAPKRDGGRGDLYLYIRPTVPDRLSDDLTALAEQMETAYSQSVRSKLTI